MKKHFLVSEPRRVPLDAQGVGGVILGVDSSIMYTEIISLIRAWGGLLINSIIEGGI